MALILPVFTTVCAERKNYITRIDEPDASMPGGELHPFVPQHRAPLLKLLHLIFAAPVPFVSCCPAAPQATKVESTA